MFSLDESALKEKADAAFDKILSEHGPQITAFIKQEIGAEALQKAQNDNEMTALAVHFYDYLPGIAKMVISQDALTKFVLDNRMLILGKLTPYLGQSA